MKRFELILLLLGFVTVAFAYAGFADRFANVFVSMNTLGVIIAITHIAGYIATRRGKNRRLVAYKRKVIRFDNCIQSLITNHNLLRPTKHKSLIFNTI